METNQPPHLVALAHPTRRIAEAGEDEAERAGRARGGGGAVDQEVRKTETRGGGGGGGGIAKDEGESRGRRGRCAKRRRETRERGGGKSTRREKRKKEKVARGVKATETAEKDDLCEGTYAAREDRGCGPLRQKRFPRMHKFLGTGNRSSPLLTGSSHGARGTETSRH